MNFGLQHGHIGQTEISEAIVALDTYSKNIYVQRKNNLVVGSEFDDIEEITDCYIETFETLQDYKDDMLENDEDYIFSEDEDEIIDFFEDGVVYRINDDGGNSYIGNDKGNVIVESITDGEVFIYSLEEAKENLKSSYINESLVIWLLR